MTHLAQLTSLLTGETEPGLPKPPDAALIGRQVRVHRVGAERHGQYGRIVSTDPFFYHVRHDDKVSRVRWRPSSLELVP